MFACDEVDGGEVAVGAVASGLCHGGMGEANNAFEDTFDLRSEPAEESRLMTSEVLATSMIGWRRLWVAQKYHLSR